MTIVKGVFTAGDGDLSIVYRMATNVYGAWGVSYTQGVEPEDFETDRELGYVGDIGEPSDELGARMWVRADVSIDQDSQTSTVPQVFKDAAERTSGDIVVEREISGAGLGGLVPHVDFVIGDEIGTVIGSKIVPLPVRSIQYVTDVDGGRDYVVTVGKGLLGNSTELDAMNAELEAQIRAETAERDRQIAEERRRREEEEQRIKEQQERDRQLARQAKDAADAADSAARTANSTALTARDLSRNLDDGVRQTAHLVNSVAHIISAVDHVYFYMGGDTSAWPKINTQINASWYDLRNVGFWNNYGNIPINLNP